MSSEINIQTLKQAETEFYPKTVSDAVIVGDKTLTEVLASIGSGEGIDYDELIKVLDVKYLSKINADEAAEVITFLKGIKDGKYVSSSSGWSIGYDDNGNSIMEIDKLLVRMEAIYNELVIEQLSYVGGARIVSPAAMTCSNVVEYDTYYRCYFDSGENGEVVQQFEIDDQARCQTFDGSNMKYYWRLVIGIGDDYIDLSKTDCDGNNATTLTMLWSHTDILSSVEARDAIGVNKEIYVKRSADKLIKYDKYGQTYDIYESALGISVTNDTAGNIIMNDYSYISEVPNLLKVLDSDGVYHAISFSLSENCIAQYLSPIRGNILSGTATMYIWGSGNSYIDKVTFTDGVQSDISTITTSSIGDYTSEAYAIDDDGDIVTHLRGNQHIAINDGLGNETIISANTINNTAGSAAFVMGGVKYIVYNTGTNYADGFTVANMTTGTVMAVHEPLTDPTTTINNSYSNQLSVQVINDTRAYIYCYTPGTMIAMYQFVIAETPSAGDDIVLCGNRTNSDRQNCIIETSYGTVSYIQYAGINSYSLAGKEVTVLSPTGNKFVGEFTFTSGDSIESTIANLSTSINANIEEITLMATSIGTNETNISSVNVKADAIQLSVSTLESDLLDTGIDIENKSITVTSDNFKVQNNDGETTFTVFEDGKIKSELIDTSGITITEMATSESGKRVEISNNSLSMYDDDGDMKLLMSGDDLGNAESSTSSTSITPITVGSSGETWDVVKVELAEFTVDSTNNTVTIPAIDISTTVSGAGTDYINNLIISIYLNDEEYFSDGFNDTSTTIASRTYPIPIGTYTLSYSITGRGASTASYGVDITTNGNAIVVKYTTELLQFSGNGMRGTFGNSSIELTDEGVILSYSGYIIRLSSSGIQKSTDGGQSWNSL
ncbi:MAG: hypothetical protein R3Y22_04565 [Bacteroidales bacterium]